MPEDHTGRFISEAVDELLDLSVISAFSERVGGASPYDPKMVLKLLLDVCSVGATSPRETERRCQADVPFRLLSASPARITGRSPGSDAVTSSLSKACSSRYWPSGPRQAW